MLIKQGASATLLIGPILDSTGAAKTDEVVGNLRLSKNGGELSTPNASATLTHGHTGNYLLALTASDTDTLGRLHVSLNSGTNALAVQGWNVIPPDVYDSLVSGFDRMPAEVDATVAQATAEAALTAYGVPTKAEMEARTLPTASYGTASPGDAMALTSSERTTLAAALEAAIINELDGTAVMQAIADLIASDMTTTDLTVAAIASAVRDAILNRVLSGNHDTAGTTGKLLQNLDESVSSRSSHSANDVASLVWSYSTRSITDKAGFTISGTVTTLDGLITSLNSTHGSGSWATAVPPTAESIADTVLSRSVASVEDTASEYSLCTLILAATVSSVSGDDLTIYKTDGATVYQTRAVSSDASAEPLTSVSHHS